MSTTSNREKLISASGGFIGIIALYLVNTFLFEKTESVLIVASMGATAVIVFSVPHSVLSQPWSVLAGHLLSALLGVTAAQFIPIIWIAAPAAVALAILAMYYLDCLHPPGGATALTAVIGGPSITSLGYQYLLTPILLNLVVLLIVAVVFNSFFKWRRYPTSIWGDTNYAKDQNKKSIDVPTHEGFIAALGEIESFTDISEEDLLRIYALAIAHDKKNRASSGSKAEGF